MAKMKPPRGGRKAGQVPASSEKITPRNFLGAIPCLLVVLVGIGLLSMLFYTALSNSLKSGVVK
jgi:hypothetical protein